MHRHEPTQSDEVSQREPSRSSKCDELVTLQRWQLERELEVPLEPQMIGGGMCSLYDIDDAIGVLRRTEIEARLGLPHAHGVEEVTEAARVVFAAVEDRLTTFAEYDGRVPGHATLWRLQILAKKALYDVLGSVPGVRRVQVSVSHAWPLTVCFGLPRRLAYEAALGVRGLGAHDLRDRAEKEIEKQEHFRLPRVSWSHGDGCHKAHPESRSLHHLLKAYCESCAKTSGNKQRRLEATFWAEKNGRPYRGTDYCSVCGTSFEKTRPDQQRCPECRRLHLGPRAPANRAG
jgi:hypothetical protein